MPAPKPRPRPLTEAGLEAAALDYLTHYASSSAHLRSVLMRRVQRAQAAGDAAAEDGARLVDAAVARCVAAGYLDDGVYAKQLAASLRRRGVSTVGIRGRLARKGVADELIRAALAVEGERGGESELAAACALARRRRLGPFRPAATRAALRDRDLGVLARAGFALGLARRVLAASDPEAVERLARGADED
jgi:regulatory protein